MSRIAGRLLAPCAWLLLAATATAQVGDEPGDAAAPAQPLAIPAAPEPAEWDGMIDQWIFGGQAADRVRSRLESAVPLQIRQFDREYGLTAAQKRKLELAGRHDIRRYFDRVDAVKTDFRRVNGDWNKVNDRVIELQNIHNRLWEIFGEGSLFAKTLRANLTAEQVAGRDRTKYRGRVEWMVGLLHSRLVLADDQRRKLIDLVAAETAPLRRYGDFDYDAIMFQMSRLPREKLRSVLDDRQCRELTIRFDQARRMESVLVSEGYLFPKPPSAGASDAPPGTHHKEARR